MGGWRLLGMCAALASCTSESETLFAAFDHVAVGSTSVGYMYFERCHGGGGGHCDLPTCEDIRVPIVSATVDDPGVFAVTLVDGDIVYTAAAPGTTTLHVVGDDDTVTERQLTAAVPDRVEATLTCQQFGVPATTPRYGTNSEVVVDYKLLGGGVELAHDAALHPLESTLLTAQDAEFSMRRATFVTPATAGAGTITSRFDPTVALAVDVFAAADATAFEQAPYNLRAGETANLPVVNLRVGASPSCTDMFTRTIAVLTPATCSSPQEAIVGPSSFQLVGIAEGTCTVEIRLDGSSLSTTFTYPVLPPA